MGEVPREVLSTSIRVRAPIEVVQSIVEDFLEYIRKNNIFPSQKVAENVYLIDIPIRGFFRTTREKLILTRSIGVAAGETKTISFSDVDNKLVLTATISPEREGFTHVHISCSSLSKLRKACNSLAEVLTNIIASAERAAPPPKPAPSETIEEEKKEEKIVEEKPVAPSIATPTSIETQSPPIREEETKPEETPPPPPATAAPATEIEKVVPEEKPREMPLEAETQAVEKPAPLRIVEDYSDKIDETGLAMLILRGELIHRTNLSPGVDVDEIIDKLKKIASENPDRIIVATISSREGPEMAAIALDSAGNASLSVKGSRGEAEIARDYNKFREFLSKLLEKRVRLAVYRMK